MHWTSNRKIPAGEWDEEAVFDLAAALDPAEDWGFSGEEELVFLDFPGMRRLTERAASGERKNHRQLRLL